MRTLIVAIVLILSTVASAGDWTLWGLTGDGADHSAGLRIGNVQDQIEFGFSANWWTMRPDWGPQPDAMGGYLIFHIDELVAVSDTDLPDAGWEEFLHKFLGRPYVGVEALIPTQGDQRTPKVNWLVGTLVSTSDDFKRSLVLEYSSGQGVASDAEKLLKIGARIRF